MVSVAVLAAFCDAQAATGRASMMPSPEVVRMPTMPTFSLNTIGNPAVTTVSQPVDVNTGHSITPTPTPDPKPADVCPDGGVKNSTYTVNMCMNDVLQCVNTGALQGGLHDLFNEDVRNSIMGGMKLCQVSVDKCIRDVRIDCHNVYNESNDVWLDFNSRIIQPEYYNFVLRKTGLTPNQAENTCLLLDRNTYGSSFAAVSDTNVVNTEYNNKVGAYNESMGGTLSKDNPQGVAVNTVGYDGNRGHYARWDAANGECLIRVAAYNKDKLITNSWLFGAVGNDNPAEVWEKAGSTFTCNKDLFDMDSLLNDTKTAAVIAVPGGAILGTAIGAGAGAGVYNKKKAAADEAAELAKANFGKDPCEDPEYVKKLQAKIGYDYIDLLKTYMWENPTVGDDGKTVTGGTAIFDNAKPYALDTEQCQAIHRLYSKIKLYESGLKNCESIDRYNAMQRVAPVAYSKATLKTALGTMICEGSMVCDETVQNQLSNECLFVPLQRGLAEDTSYRIFCNEDHNCLPAPVIRDQKRELERLLATIKPVVAEAGLEEEGVALNKGKEIGKGAAIGAATGLAAGGIATAITAFVEKSNITCKVGDGLNSVALGKAHTIGSLKDFYVKWNLNLPDTVSPTSAVVDKASWEQACGQFNNKLSECPKVQINLKDTNGKYTLVPSACKVSGTICIMNDSVATSHGIK